MNLLERLLPWKRRAAEGAYRPPPYFLTDGWLGNSAGRLINWWQAGYSLTPYGESSAMVEACIGAYSQTVAMCPGDHWRKETNGSRTRVTTSALSRIMKSPNDYQSISDFLLNLTRTLYDKGESFGLCVRNSRAEVVEIHLMRYGSPIIAADGSIFYRLGGNEIIERRYDLSYPIPARDVLHVRLHTPVHPLKGHSPVLSTVLDRAMAGAALNQQVAYFLNQARPSFMLETDQKLTVEQVKELRELWDNQTKGDAAGGTPILTWGLKGKPVESTSAKDSDIANLLKLSDQNIALAFRVPLQILGLGGSPLGSTEALMQSWIATGLGFTLNHIEEAFGQLFGLKGVPDEYLELDTKALLRSAFKDRIEAYARGVLGGILSPDEARSEFDLAAVEGGFGKSPRVQQQVVPLEYGANLKPPDPNKTATPALPAPADDAQKSEEEVYVSPEQFAEHYFNDPSEFKVLH